MKKWSLRQRMRFSNGIGLVGLVLLAIGCMFNDRAVLLPCVLGIALLFTSLILINIWWHCPHCHRGLGRVSYPNFCPHCGEKIDYDAKEE